jgi:hypothetical protein
VGLRASARVRHEVTRAWSMRTIAAGIAQGSASASHSRSVRGGETGACPASSSDSCRQDMPHPG